MLKIDDIVTLAELEKEGIQRMEGSDLGNGKIICKKERERYLIAPTSVDGKYKISLIYYVPEKKATCQS